MDDEQETQFTNIQVDWELLEMLKALKKRYGTRSMREAMKRFIADHDPKVAEIGRKRAALMRTIEELDDDE
jgi:hypothetical protein